jgi:hypothetical protein
MHPALARSKTGILLGWKLMLELVLRLLTMRYRANPRVYDWRLIAAK